MPLWLNRYLLSSSDLWMCTILHLENIKARAELSPAAQASASLRSCAYWQLTLTPISISTWSGNLFFYDWPGRHTCSAPYGPHPIIITSILYLFSKKWTIPYPIIKLTNSLFPTACPCPTSLPTFMCIIPLAPLWGGCASRWGEGSPHQGHQEMSLKT